MSGDSVEFDSGNDFGDGDSKGDSGDFESALALCQDRDCRIVLGTLAAEQRPLTLNDLTHLVYRNTHQASIVEATEDTLTEIRLSLHHSHFPKLASGGFIQFDPEGHLVKPTEKLEKVERTLTTLLDADPSLEGPMGL